MQDRFKFRAWNEKEHKYLDDDSFEAKIYHNATELLGVCLALDKGNAKYDYIFEQCTGCRDCDDNLIYEGDIVHAPGWSTPFVVIFKDGKFLLSKNNRSFYLMPVYVWIIGNVHENADLLEEDEEDDD